MRKIQILFVVVFLSVAAYGATHRLVLSHGGNGYSGVFDTWAADWIWDGNNGHGSAVTLGILQEFCPS
ncbi:MAG: hypothetical protein ACQEQ4_03870 [Fibrobacterota bacterium]